MDLETYRRCIESISFGKRLPGAIYVIRPSQGHVPSEVLETIRRAEIAAQPDASWNLLKRLGLAYEGHSFISAEKGFAETAELEIEPVGVERHRTAIKRYDLSKPVKQLLERGLLKKTDTFFDYGCGHGMDIEALQHL